MSWDLIFNTLCSDTLIPFSISFVYFFQLLLCKYMGWICPNGLVYFDETMVPRISKIEEENQVNCREKVIQKMLLFVGLFQIYNHGSCSMKSEH